MWVLILAVPLCLLDDLGKVPASVTVRGICLSCKGLFLCRSEYDQSLRLRSLALGGRLGEGPPAPRPVCGHHLGTGRCRACLRAPRGTSGPHRWRSWDPPSASSSPTCGKAARRQVLSRRTGVWRRGSPCRRSPWLSPPELLSAEQQHLTHATREGPSDLGHLRAQAQLVQTPRA